MKGCEQLEIELETLKFYLLSFVIYALLALIAIIWSVDPESIRFKSMTGLYLSGAVVMILLSDILLKNGLKSRHKSMVVVVLGLQLLALLITASGGVDGSAAFGPDVVMLSIETNLSDDDLRLTLSGLIREGAVRVDEFGHFFLN